VFRQERSANCGAGSHEAQPAIPVAPKQPLNKSVAKAAVAVKDDLQPPAALFVCAHVVSACSLDENPGWRDHQSLTP
jgi:hypothetical protein